MAHNRKRAYAQEEYWGKPVTGFGDKRAKCLVIGLAPGAHGANRTGRMFTGDGSGVFLFKALYRAGFCNQPQSRNRQDGLVIENMFISAVCRCAPPGNKPTPQEIANCLPFLKREIMLLPGLKALVTLGRIAFSSTLKLYRQLGNSIPDLDFSHGVVYSLGEHLPKLIVSYHPSRQNTQTGRLTVTMFSSVWEEVMALLQGETRGSGETRLWTPPPAIE